MPSSPVPSGCRSESTRLSRRKSRVRSPWSHWHRGLSQFHSGHERHEDSAEVPADRWRRHPSRKRGGHCDPCGFDPRSFRRVFMRKTIWGSPQARLLAGAHRKVWGSTPPSSAHASIAEGISIGLLIRGPWFDSKWGHSGDEDRLPAPWEWVPAVERQLATRFGLTHRISS